MGPENFPESYSLSPMPNSGGRSSGPINWNGIVEQSAGGVIGGLGSVISQVMANREAEKARKWNAEQVRQQNEYNSYGAQLRRMIEAGVDPATAKAAMLGVSPTAGGAATTEATPVNNFGEDIVKGLQGMASANNLNASTEGMNIDNQTRAEENKMKLDIGNANLKEMASRTDLNEIEANYRRQFDPKMLAQMDDRNQMIYLACQRSRLEFLLMGGNADGSINPDAIQMMQDIAKKEWDIHLEELRKKNVELADFFEHFETDMKSLRSLQDWKVKLAQVNYNLAKLSEDEQKQLGALPVMSLVAKYCGPMGAIAYACENPAELQKIIDGSYQIGQMLGQSLVDLPGNSVQQMVEQLTGKGSPRWNYPSKNFVIDQTQRDSINAQWEPHGMSFDNKKGWKSYTHNGYRIYYDPSRWHYHDGKLYPND